MTVRGALDFYARIEGGNADEVISLLSLEELKDKKVSDLSQGQKKRVSIAKVFLRERDLYLLDEPTSNLDPASLEGDKGHSHSDCRRTGSSFTHRTICTKRVDVGHESDSCSGRGDRIFRQDLRHKVEGVPGRDKDDDRHLEDDRCQALETAATMSLSVSTPEDAGLALKKLVENGVLVTEMRQLDNPLQDLFEANHAQSSAAKTEKGSEKQD